MPAFAVAGGGGEVGGDSILERRLMRVYTSHVCKDVAV